MNVVIRILLVGAGAIAALFVSRDDQQFDFIQTMLIVLLVAILLIAANLWSAWRKPRV